MKRFRLLGQHSFAERHGTGRRFTIGEETLLHVANPYMRAYCNEETGTPQLGREMVPCGFRPGGQVLHSDRRCQARTILGSIRLNGDGTAEPGERADAGRAI